MARIPLHFTGWQYDDETKRIIATFVDAPGPGHEDPVSFQPTMNLEVELLPRVIDAEPIPQPEEEKIEQLGTVVDQLVIDMLMSQLGAMGLDLEGFN